LHYAIDVGKPGARIWFDVTSEGGRAQLARSSVYQLAEAGSHSFELQVPLANDADRIEGRMLAHGGESLKGYGIRIRGAQLSVTGAAPH
jgi:hypothetical protein